MTHVRSMPFTLGRLVALAAVLVGLLIAGAGTAHANGQLYSTTTEGFEAGHSNLKFFTYSPAEAKLENWWLPVIHQNQARTGTGNAYLAVKKSATGVGGTAGFHRMGVKTANGGCWAQFWVNPMGATRRLSLGAQDSKGWILPTKIVDVSGSGYKLVTFHFSTAWQPVTFSVHMFPLGSGQLEQLRVDDLKVDCYVIA